MLRVMIESPYRAPDFETLIRNLDYANACVRDSLRRGEAPFAMHLFYPNWLQDEIDEEREQGISCGLAWLDMADFVALYTDYGLSPGMKLARERAIERGIMVDYRSILTT